MQSILCSALILSLSSGWAPPAVGMGKEPAQVGGRASDRQPEYDPALLARAESFWSAGRYTEARQLLEPLATDGPIDDRLFREKLLTYLADATINDPQLPEDERRERAAAELNRLMDRDPTWRMPPNLFSFELFNLYLDLRMERAEKAGEVCGANLVACQSSVDNAASELRRQQQAYAALQRKYAEQEIEVRDRVARSRLFAAIPFGVGHFYNGDRALGAAFLSTEVAIGLTGIALLLQRTVTDRCDRTSGWQPESLSCDPRNSRTTQDAIVSRRKAEEAMAWLFLGTVVLDVLIAQARFRPYEIASVRRVKRRDLDSSGGAPVPDDARRKRREKKSRGKPRATIRPSPAFHPRGGGMNVEIRF